MHLAQLNVGRLVAETDDPRVAEFMAALDRVNGLGKRMPGFVWMMEGSGAPGTGNTETKIGGDPRLVSNLTVWESVEALETFVWNTVHRQFYERRREWFEVLGEQHFVMWWVPEGHRPTLDEALARLRAPAGPRRQRPRLRLGLGESTSVEGAALWRCGGRMSDSQRQGRRRSVLAKFRFPTKSDVRADIRGRYCYDGDLLDIYAENRGAVVHKMAPLPARFTNDTSALGGTGP